MPVHDWTRVIAGIFHDFHLGWIATLSKALNNGVLPSSHYSMIEPAESPAGVEPPAILDDATSEAALLASRRRRLTVRRETDDRIVALFEVVPPGSKENASALDAFVDKAVRALDEGYHLLVVDLFPPGPFDPRGMHGAIWSRFGGSHHPSADKLLTLAAYVASAGQPAGIGVTCWVEPAAVGQALAPMPLFLDPGRHVNVPLEETYLAAYEGVPRRWKRVIEGAAAN